jgi:aromatic ring-cleaving dioxygenase
MKYYHAHIYFDSAEAKLIEKLNELALKTNGFKLSHIHTTPVGPHPKPMLELHFDEEMNEKLSHWIDTNRGNLSVLIHLETGNDLRDHTENVVWLGKKLLLDFSFFELIKSRPDLKVHSD